LPLYSSIQKTFLLSPFIKAYLVAMRSEKKVQFVCFETILDKEPFIKRWEQFTRSLNSNADVTLQQSEKDGTFRYIAQHRFVAGELLFVFSKEERTSRLAQVQIKTKQVGGYSLFQGERLHDAIGNESKVFVFLTDARTDLDEYKKLSAAGKLNIYEAYYENCKYAYILEYFMKSKHVSPLMEQLNQFDTTEIGIYKECNLTKNMKEDKKKDSYVWPSV